MLQSFANSSAVLSKEGKEATQMAGTVRYTPENIYLLWQRDGVDISCGLLISLGAIDNSASRLKGFDSFSNSPGSIYMTFLVVL